jgi:hypothetical protein
MPNQLRLNRDEYYAKLALIQEYAIMYSRSTEICDEESSIICISRYPFDDFDRNFVYSYNPLE